MAVRVTASGPTRGSATYDATDPWDYDFPEEGVVFQWEHSEDGIKVVPITVYGDFIRESDEVITLEFEEEYVCADPPCSVEDPPPSRCATPETDISPYAMPTIDITIMDDDPAPTATIVDAHLESSESARERKIVVKFWPPFSSEGLYAGLSIDGGTATEGVDWTVGSGTISIPPNTYVPYGAFPFHVIDDEVVEGDESIVACVGASCKTFWILDDDFADEDDPDGDGMPYLYEVQMGLNPLLDDGDIDIDGDGITNDSEYGIFDTAGYTPSGRGADLNNDGIIDSVGYVMQVPDLSLAAPYYWHAANDLLNRNNMSDDTDADSVENEEELAAGSDAYRADTDGDGHDDGADDFPLDPARHEAPAPDPNDPWPPMITLSEPHFASN